MSRKSVGWPEQAAGGVVKVGYVREFKARQDNEWLSVLGKTARELWGWGEWSREKHIIIFPS